MPFKDKARVRAKDRAYYLAHKKNDPACKARRKAELISRIILKKEYVDRIKLDRGCADCGYRLHPAALQFDHLPGTGKLLNLSTLRASFSGNLKDIDAEIAKCEVVCANCHAIRTANRRNKLVK